MKHKLIEAYKDEFPALKSLSSEIKNNIIEIIFAYRQGIETITLGFESADFVSKLTNYLPSDFYEKTRKYGIDFESIGSDKVRLYKTLDTPTEFLKGYYINNNKVIETKIYKRSEQRGLILIDRYDEKGNIISENEVEVRATAEEWKGSALIAKIAEANNFFVNYLRKRDKDQCYARVRIINY